MFGRKNIANEELAKEALEVIFSESGESLAERLDDYHFDDDIEDEWEDENDFQELKKILINHIYSINNNQNDLEHFIDVFSGINL